MIWEWLLAPIDSARLHEMSLALSWHGRLMTLAWGFLAPGAVLVARFAKILPWQDWPARLDTQTWWNTHWISQSLALLCSLAGLLLVLGDPGNSGGAIIHRILGYTVLALGCFQLLSGICRGSKGGPGSLAKDGSQSGDHYNMTLWRRAFELLHKTLGYAVLILAIFTIISGLWAANAPKWMFVSLGCWWLVLFLTFVRLQKSGYAVDTYQAIWGPGAQHPGNRLPPPGWGVVRPSEKLQSQKGE